LKVKRNDKKASGLAYSLLTLDIRATRLSRSDRMRPTRIAGLVFVLGALAPVSAHAQGTWVQHGTLGASDVAVSPTGIVWLVGRDRRTTGPALIRDQTTYAPAPPGTPARVAVDPAGSAWVVNTDGTVWNWGRNTNYVQDWVQASLAAMDIAVGANGHVWAISTGQRVMQFTNGRWEGITGAGVRIAVDPSGNPWVVNSAGQIWKYSGTSWAVVPGSATDIAIAPDGTVFILGTARVAGGFEVLRLKGSSWEHILGGGGVAIAAGRTSVFVAQDVTTQRVVTSASSALSVNPNPPAAVAVAAPPPPAPAPTTTGTGTAVSVTLQGQAIDVTPSTAPPAAPASPSQELDIRGVASRPQPEAALPGTLVCPIIGTGARLLKGCQFVGQAARFVREAPPTGCVAPSFADPRNGGECWTCPANFTRNVSPVDSKDACWKPIGEVLAKATLAGRTGCAAGFFSDPRNGGECWACPAGFGRTLDPVTAGTACSKGIFGPFSVATFGNKIGQCTGGAFGDPIDGGTCWTCPAGFRRTLNSVKSDGACAQMTETQYATATQNKGCSLYRALPGFGTPFRDPRNGGECWACPLGLVRSASAVNTDATGNLAACVAGGNTDKVIYQMAQYPESGPYRFMPGLLKMSLADTKAVDAFMTKRAKGNSSVKRQLWNNMKADPASSAELKALLFASLVTAAKSPNPDVVSAAAVREFEIYMRSRRAYVAHEAVTMYEKWKDLDAYNQYQAARRSSGIGGISADVIGAAPPDFKGFAWSGAVPDSAGSDFVVASASLSALASGTTSVGSVVSDVGSFQLSYLDPVTKALEKGLDALQDQGKEMIKGATTLSRLADGAMVLKSAEAAMIATTLVSGAIEISKGVMTLIEKDKAEAAYSTYVSEMDRHVTVKQMLESTNPQDQQSLLLFWALATSPYKAGDKVGTGRMTTAELCASNAWTTAQCTVAKEMVTAAARAAGY
jgi:hypothetical protein